MNDSTTAIEKSAELYYSATPNPKWENPSKFARNRYGLLENVDYKYDSAGWIDWKSMIDPKYLYPNKGYFERANLAVPETIDGLEDHQLTCKLGGYKELARLRGFKSVDYKLDYLPNGVSAKCTIEWLPNYETSDEPVVFSSLANSTSENCGEFFSTFKETQAENRSFCRCVRNFLNINIASDDEMNKGKTKDQPKEESAPDALDPHKTLASHCKSKGYKTFKAFKSEFLLPLEQNGGFKPKTGTVESWETLESVPTNEVSRIIALLNK